MLAGPLRFEFVRFITESVPELVRDCQVEELAKGDVPNLKQLNLSLWLINKQSLFEKCLAHLEVAESRTVGTQVKPRYKSFPIFGPNQNPSPTAQDLGVVAVKDWSQNGKLAFTLRNGIRTNTHEFLTCGSSLSRPDYMQAIIGTRLD